MKADKSKMFPVPMKKLLSEEGAPFPLFLFFKRNDRFIPIRLPDDALGRQKYEKFMHHGFVELWVPNTFQDVYKTYLEYLEKTTGSATATPEEAMAELEASLAEPPKPQSEEAALVHDVLTDDELSTEEKAQVLSAVSQDLLRALNQITTRGEDARSEGLHRCKEIADEVLSVAAQNSNIYDEILALRNSQEDIEHSVIVGTIAVMFGLAIGFTDEQMLGDLTIAAIFHDIGLVRVKPEVMAKKEAAWSVPDRKEYETHVSKSVEILKESGTAFHPRVFRMVEEHHENYDGSGFPKGTRGAQLDETSQVLHLANLFDRLCTGKQTGTDLSPADAFDYIYDLAQDPNAVQEVQPELVVRVFQFMSAEKESADKLKVDAGRRVEEAMKQKI